MLDVDMAVSPTQCDLQDGGGTALCRQIAQTVDLAAEEAMKNCPTKLGEADEIARDALRQHNEIGPSASALPSTPNITMPRGSKHNNGKVTQRPTNTQRIATQHDQSPQAFGGAAWPALRGPAPIGADVNRQPINT